MSDWIIRIDWITLSVSACTNQFSCVTQSDVITFFTKVLLYQKTDRITVLSRWSNHFSESELGEVVPNTIFKGFSGWVAGLLGCRVAGLLAGWSLTAAAWLSVFHTRSRWSSRPDKSWATSQAESWILFPVKFRASLTSLHTWKQPL